MRHLTLGVIGHVDHGKTALVRALTGIDTDRLAEEKERGISIALGFAHLDLPDGTLDFVDMPGHERFVRTMVSGATGIGAVLLVVAANEGIKLQTVEHLEIARLLGVRHGLVAVTKRDLIEAEAAQAMADAAQALATGLGGLAMVAPPVLVSAPTGAGLPELRGALAALLTATAASEDHGFCHLPTDRVFAVPGFGPVVTGTLRRGRLAVGDEVEILPDGLRARVRSLQQHGRAVEAVEPGRRVAVNLRGVRTAELRRGCVLASPGSLASGRWLDVELRLLASASRPLADGAVLKLLVGTSETAARVRLLGQDQLLPGGTALAQLHAADELALPAQEPFIVRAGSPMRTVGGGRVLAAASRRRRRHEATTLAFLSTLARAEPVATITASLDEAGARGENLQMLGRLVGQVPARIRPLVKQAGGEAFGDGTVLHAGVAASLQTALLKAAEAFHRQHPDERGLTREQLRRALSAGLPANVAAELMAKLVDRGELVPREGLLCRKGFRPSAAQAQHEAAVRRLVEAAFRQGGLMPPDPAEVIGQEAGRRQALQALVRDGILLRALDRVQKRELVFHRDAVALACRTLAASFPPGTPFLVGEAGRRLGVSRKYSVPLLEHLDVRKFTRRDGDRRIVCPPSGRHLGEEAVKGPGSEPSATAGDEAI